MRSNNGALHTRDPSRLANAAATYTANRSRPAWLAVDSGKPVPGSLCTAAMRILPMP